MSGPSIEPGMWVECVESAPLPSTQWDPGEKPRLGAIYSVRGTGQWDDGEAIVYLRELDRSARSRLEHGERVGYGAFRFRPIYCPDETLIARLLEPLSEHIREHV